MNIYAITENNTWGVYRSLGNYPSHTLLIGADTKEDAIRIFEEKWEVNWAEANTYGTNQDKQSCACCGQRYEIWPTDTGRLVGVEPHSWVFVRGTMEGTYTSIRAHEALARIPHMSNLPADAPYDHGADDQAAECPTCRGTGWDQGGCDECGATGVLGDTQAFDRYISEVI